MNIINIKIAVCSIICLIVSLILFFTGDIEKATYFALLLIGCGVIETNK